MNTPSPYRAGYILDPELTSLALVRQAVAAGLPVRVEPVNDVSLGDEVCIVKLFVDRVVRTKRSVCGTTKRRTVAIFKARINGAGFVEEVLK